MGSQPQTIFPGQDDPKYLDLIEKITQKTLANKISWTMTQTGVSANVSGKIELGFVRGRGGIFATRSWALFTIRDANGNEILRVESGPRTPIEILAGGVPDRPLMKAVDTLYAAIEQLGGAEVEKIIELIDKI